MKRILAMLLVLVMAMGILTGCGSKENEQPENTDGQTDADGAAGGTDEPIKDDVTIRIGGLKRCV